MSIETGIKDVITKNLQDGVVEKLVAEQLEKGISSALNNLFGHYGDVTKIIEENIKSVMVPYLENYDYSEYIVKLDSVLVDVLKNCALDNKKILTNFKELITEGGINEVMKVSELFNKWTEYVAKNVETTGLQIDYDDGVSYARVPVEINVEYDEGREWSSYEYATLIFECEHDGEMNFELKLYRWKEDKEKMWTIDYKTACDITSIKNLNEFEIFLMKLNQNRTKIEIDTEFEEDEVAPEAEPEADFS